MISHTITSSFLFYKDLSVLNLDSVLLVFAIVKFAWVHVRPLQDHRLELVTVVLRFHVGDKVSSSTLPLVPSRVLVS